MLSEPAFMLPKIQIPNTRTSHPDAALIRKCQRVVKMKHKETDLAARSDRLYLEASIATCPSELKVCESDRELFKFCEISVPEFVITLAHIDTIRSRGAWIDPDGALAARRTEIIGAEKRWSEAIDAYDKINGWLTLALELEHLGCLVAKAMKVIKSTDALTAEGMIAKLAVVAAAHREEGFSDKIDAAIGTDGVVWSLMRDMTAHERSPAILANDPCEKQIPTAPTTSLVRRGLLAHAMA